MDKGRNTICKDTEYFIQTAFSVLYPLIKTEACLHQVPEPHSKRLDLPLILKVMANKHVSDFTIKRYK